MTDRVRVKICGISDVDTALAAVAAGADALGFVFAPSRRWVNMQTAREIIKQLPPLVARVGVFVNASPEEVREHIDYCGLTAVQLSGDEPPDFKLNSPVPMIRALRVGRGRVLPQLSDYDCQAFLFDTYLAGSYGGTGSAFDWRFLDDVPRTKPLILAGGLSVANVRGAVRMVKPYAVDVSGGVETGGCKDVQKIKEFIALAKEVLTND